MVVTFIDKVYKELKKYGVLDLLKEASDIGERIKKLNEILINWNVTKCQLFELDFFQDYGSLYLEFLLQNESGINFGICENFKMWYNRQGVQMRCKNLKNKQVMCFGNKNKCEIG
jgi:hypothetical protein